jgi:uncharacterized protein YdeI (BOF family)
LRVEEVLVLVDEILRGLRPPGGLGQNGIALIQDEMVGSVKEPQDDVKVVGTLHGMLVIQNTDQVYCLRDKIVRVV